MFRALFSIAVALTLLLVARLSQARLLSGPRASPTAAASENASTVFSESGSESRIGLLCHNDPDKRQEYGSELTIDTGNIGIREASDE